MIVFDLSCVCGCQFEGWFLDRENYTRQEQEGLLLCPVCNRNEVSKILSPVARVGYIARKEFGVRMQRICL